MSSIDTLARSARAKTTKPFDVIEHEFAMHRINESEKAALEWLRDLLETKGHVGSTNWSDGDRVDAKSSADARQMRELQSASTTKRLLKACSDTIGVRRWLFMKYVIRSYTSLTECARTYGNGKRTSYERFVLNWREDVSDLTDLVFIPEIVIKREAAQEK